VNRSRLPVSVSMEPSLGVLAAHDVSAANAASPVVIKAHQTGSLSLTYKPTKRARPFTEAGLHEKQTTLIHSSTTH